MLRTVLLSLGASTAIHCGAQNFYQIGYRWDAFDLAALNASIDRYNEQRPWLDQQLGHFGPLRSVAIGVGQRLKHGRFGAELYMHSGRMSQDAHGPEPNGGLMGYRRLSLNNWGYALGLQFMVISSKHLELHVEPGFDYANTTLTTRYCNNGDLDNAESTSMDMSFTYCLNLGLKLDLYAARWLGVSLRPNYLFRPDALSCANWYDIAGPSNEASTEDPLRHLSLTAMLMVMPNRRPR